MWHNSIEVKIILIIAIDLVLASSVCFVISELEGPVYWILWLTLSYDGFPCEFV